MGLWGGWGGFGGVAGKSGERPTVVKALRLCRPRKLLVARVIVIVITMPLQGCRMQVLKITSQVAEALRCRIGFVVKLGFTDLALKDRMSCGQTFVRKPSLLCSKFCGAWGYGLIEIMDWNPV